MKLAYTQLDAHLTKTLAPLYVLSGDDILLADEALTAIRQAATRAGFTERVIITAEPKSDWVKALHAEAHNLSLFAAKRLIELRLQAAKPNASTTKLFQETIQTLPDTSLVIITTNKLDARTEQTAWFKALMKVGVCVPVWPLSAEQLPQWLKQRASNRGVTLTADAAKFLATQVEGNLLAAAQEIDKLALLNTTGTIDRQALTELVTDSAHYDIFNLVETALAGDSVRALRILAALQAEGTEPILVLWALVRELRLLADLASKKQQGANLANLFSQYRVWEKRQGGMRQFLQKHSVERCWQFLQVSQTIDRMIKGAAPSNPWLAFQQLAVAIAGNAILPL